MESSPYLEDVSNIPPINVKPVGAGGGVEARAWGGDLIIFAFAAPRVGHLNYLTPPGEGIFETFFSRLALGSIKNLRYCGIIVNRNSVFKRENSIRLKTCIKV